MLDASTSAQRCERGTSCESVGFWKGQELVVAMLALRSPDSLLERRLLVHGASRVRIRPDTGTFRVRVA